MNDKKIEIDLDGVGKTLLMPLWGRAKETEKSDPLIYDTYARKIVDNIQYNFSKMESGFNETERLVWVIRAFVFDNTIVEFISTHEDSLIINIGAGLDTTFHRIDNGKVEWVNIDLPDVILLRKKLMLDSEREISIGKSVFDFGWMDDIGKIVKNKAVMITAAGVFFYFEEERVKKLFSKIADVYPTAHVVFDSFPRFVTWSWNRELKKGDRGRLEPSTAPMKWHLNGASRLEGWIDTLKVVDEYPMCSRIKYKKSWNKKLVFQLKIMNFLRLYNMIHIKFTDSQLI